MALYHKTELDIFDCEYSVLMSEYLEKEGFGLLKRNENRCTQVIVQLAELITISCKSITTGGLGESSGLPESSDSDFMLVLKGFRVLEDNNLPLPGCDEDGVTYISIKRNKQFPGFCKLELSKKSYEKLQKCSRVINSTQNLKQIISSVIKQGDNLLISSKLLKTNLTIHGLLPPINPNDPLFEVSGPAIKNRSTDYVRAFEFDVWPQEAKMWKERRRKNNWPSKKVLDRLEKEASCYVVPKGNESSVDFEVEWNLSFVEIERELITGMNDTPFKCYICLKRLKKTILNKTCAGLEKISTYQVKNIMFWLCEMISEHEWKTGNLFRYVRLGLMKLKNCIWLGYNAHYFIPEMNLWRNVKLSASEKKRALNFLTSLIDEPTIVIFLLDFSKDVTRKMNIPTILKLQTYLDRRNVLLDYGSKCLNETNLEHLYKEMLSRFPDTKIFFPCMAITKAKIRLQHQLNYYIDLMCSQTLDKYSLKTLIKSSVSGIVEEMKAGHEIDYLTASLNIALVCNCFKRYSDVLEELKPKLFHTSRKLYAGSRGLWFLDLNSAEVQRVNDDVIDQSEDKQNMVFDFHVRPLDSDIIPFPLKLQFCIIADIRTSLQLFPLVLAYYLLFTAEHYLGLKGESEATRKLLVSAALNIKVHKFSYFDLYLVGYSYYVTGDMKEALNWFAQSAIHYPSNHNAAVYQIAIMISKKELKFLKP